MLAAGFAVTIWLALMPVAMAADSAEIDAMLVRANELVSTDPAEGGVLLDQIAALSDSLSNQQRYRLQIVQAKLLAIRGQYSKALKILESLSREDLSVNSLALSNSIESSIYNALGDYDQMFAIIQKNLALVDEITDISLKAGFMHPAMVAFRDAGAYEQSVSQGLQMLQLARESEFPRSECFALVELGITERMAGNWNAALDWLKDAEVFCSDIGNKLIVNSARANLAALALDGGDTEQAIAIASRTLPDAEEVGYAYHIAELKSVLATAYLASGDLDASLHLGEEALSLARQSGLKLFVRHASKTLADIHERRGDLPAALTMFKIYLEASQFLTDDRSAMALAYYQNLYATQDKERQIQILNQQNELLTLSRALSEKQRQNLQLSLIIGLLLIVALIGWLVSVNMQRHRFRNLAQRDGLTGIANRSHFNQAVDKMVKDAFANGDDLGLILMDLDNFKAINDSYGHGAGDWVLKNVAEICRHKIRKNDLFGRIGGEEFALCLPGAGLEESLRVAEICRKAIKAMDTSALGHSFEVSGSFGVAIRHPHEAKLEPIFTRADNCLYDAKHAGRDQVRYEGDHL
ncbi:GGDEF domain-containing protein [Iodidimonas gelatinilytica]|uniref:diguanylate cyclase n=1 Tax=Iodidimonas gelatinilytica TaxID=1236966 RepID=A0A5A7MQR9_9PROT|nr:GGDEF domain-containing protein [Iodidimonas gelatinilytica]GEQ98281.1 GGDEF domain-containing protein [Iodidimonas gelatinilytica]